MWVSPFSSRCSFPERHSQFAGFLHASPGQLSDALRGLESSGVRIVIAKSMVPPVLDGRRVVMLELVGPDRPGIVRELSRSLADRGVNIDELHTEIVGADSAGHTFKVKALLMIPESLTNLELQRGLESLESAMSVDIRDQFSSRIPISRKESRRRRISHSLRRNLRTLLECQRWANLPRRLRTK